MKNKVTSHAAKYFSEEECLTDRAEVAVWI